MHQGMQLGGLLHAQGCTNSPNTHTESSSRFGPKSGGGGDIICFHAILTEKCSGTICLSVQPALFFHVSVRVPVWRERERSVQQLFLHLYEQIPVGRAAEEHTSCLTYIPYQSVFVCTVMCHMCICTHTHTLKKPCR